MVTNSKIINGTSSFNSDIQSIVSINYGENTICTGNLITPQKVVSAAHCFFLGDMKSDVKLNQLKLSLENYAMLTGITSRMIDNRLVKDISLEEKLLSLREEDGLLLIRGLLESYVNWSMKQTKLNIGFSLNNMHWSLDVKKIKVNKEYSYHLANLLFPTLGYISFKSQEGISKYTVDSAIIELGDPVEGVSPTPLVDESAHPVDWKGLVSKIVAFGNGRKSLKESQSLSNTDSIDFSEDSINFDREVLNDNSTASIGVRIKDLASYKGQNNAFISVPEVESQFSAICNGDSGGPVFGLIGEQYVQIGIISGGMSCEPNSIFILGVLT